MNNLSKSLLMAIIFVINITEGICAIRNDINNNNSNPEDRERRWIPVLDGYGRELRFGEDGEIIHADHVPPMPPGEMILQPNAPVDEIRQELHPHMNAPIIPDEVLGRRHVPLNVIAPLPRLQPQLPVIDHPIYRIGIDRFPRRRLHIEPDQINLMPIHKPKKVIKAHSIKRSFSMGGIQSNKIVNPVIVSKPIKNINIKAPLKIIKAPVKPIVLKKHPPKKITNKTQNDLIKNIIKLRQQIVNLNRSLAKMKIQLSKQKSLEIKQNIKGNSFSFPKKRKVK